MTTIDPAGTLEDAIRAMDEEPSSGVGMCHEQRKTAVYLSDDGRYIIEQEPNGTIRTVRSSSPPSPWPAAPAAGIASARRGSTPCVAGVGFAVHRTPHCVVHCCPHKCGHRRARFRRRAAHYPVQLPLHFPPLKRRGGSDEPLSPAPTSRCRRPRFPER